MQTGALLIVIGIAIGYSLPFWINKTTVGKVKKFIANNQGIIVDLTEPPEIGEPLTDDKETVS